MATYSGITQENPMVQRSLGGYSPCRIRIELDTAEHAHMGREPQEYLLWNMMLT